MELVLGVIIIVIVGYILWIHNSTSPSIKTQNAEINAQAEAMPTATKIGRAHV